MMHRCCSHLFFWLLLLVALAATSRTVSATMIVQSHDPNLHDRFQNHANFIGNPHDWSGVAQVAIGVSTNHWATMISNHYFVTADHFAPVTNDTIRFYHSNDLGGTFEDHTISGGTQIGVTDLYLGRLNTPVSASVQKYPVFRLPNDDDYENVELFNFGLATGGSATNQRLGRNVIEADVDVGEFGTGTIVTASDGGKTGQVYLFEYDVPGLGDDETYLQSGDSGAPSLTIFNGKPAVVGVHWFVSTDTGNPTLNVDYSADTLIAPHISAMNAIMDSDGESVLFVPEPSIPEPSAPQVTQLLVGSSNWSQGFADVLGSTAGFYSVPTDDDQLNAVPWSIDEVRIVFSDDVSISHEDLQVIGSETESIDVQAMEYAPATHTATWTIDRVTADKLLFALSDEITSISSGLALDGEYTTQSGLMPTGDGTPGGDFHFRFNVLTGDADGNGVNSLNDLQTLASNWQQPTDASNMFGDFDGSGQTTLNDLQILATHWGRSLPLRDPTIPPVSAAVPEPSSWLFLVVGMLLVASRSRTSNP